MTLTVAGSSNYSIEDCLVSSVSVHERERTVKTMCQIVTMFIHLFGKLFRAEHLCFLERNALFFTGM